MIWYLKLKNVKRSDLSPDEEEYKKNIYYHSLQSKFDLKNEGRLQKKSSVHDKLDFAGK